MNTPGYEQLAAVLQAAYDQAATGKGAERHADSKPFHEQPMQTGSDLLGTDAGLAFQAIKKIREGSTFAEFERFEREMLGAINYIAGMVIWRRRHRDANLADDLQAMAAEGGTAHALFHGPEIYTMTNPPGEDIYAQFAAALREKGLKRPCPELVCDECECPADAAGTHYATCSKLTAPKEFVDQVEQTFDELEVGAANRCPGCGVDMGDVHYECCPLRVEPAAEIDDESPRAQALGQNGNDGAVYDDPWFGAPEWAKYKAQDADGRHYFYESKPRPRTNLWHYDGRAAAGTTGEPNPNWRDTLIERP